MVCWPTEHTYIPAVMVWLAYGAYIYTNSNGVLAYGAYIYTSSDGVAGLQSIHTSSDGVAGLRSIHIYEQ